MKRVIFLLLILFATPAFSQVFDPVSWDFGYEEKGENLYEIVLTATIEEHSHIYSMSLPEGGPIPTTFHFNELNDFTLDGNVKQIGNAEEVYDEGFEMKVTYFSNKVVYRQTIKSDKPSFAVTGYVNYMACDNKQCSPPKDVDFSVNITAKNTTVQAAAPSQAKEPAQAAVTIPETASEQVVVSTPANETEQKGKGLLGFFFWSMLAGFVGVLTPCVFPMIPMTVAFFTKGSDNKSKTLVNALVFGLSILLIYSSLGIIVSLTSAGAGFANALSTHWIPNLLFFTLFLIFAASFFGAFEIVLPSKWVNSTDAKVDKGGVIAAFFLGLTTVLVSFSCTGPLVGALLVEAASGSVLRPTVGMFGFGLAFALPFTMFALFPSLMNKLPKSGGWLNSIKVVLAFIMLAFALKFLSKIDEVYNLGILNRDVFIALWIVIFSLLGFYLLGKIKFEHDSDVPHIGIFRLTLVIAVFSFVVYLIPGLFGAPLKGISSLLPSRESQQFDISNTGYSKLTQQSSQPGLNLSGEVVKYADILTLPEGLQGYFDYQQGMAYAKKIGKPVLLDFKGHACTNCKKMESAVWSDPEVLRRLRENFVIVALYVDDRTKLPENEWVKSSVDGKVKTTMGKVNEDFEMYRFKTNALPLYVILDNDGNTLGSTMTYNTDKEKYIKWLDTGVKLFQSK